MAQGRARSPPRPRCQRKGATKGRPEQQTDPACAGRDRRRDAVPGQGRGARNPRAGERTRRLLARDSRRRPEPASARPGREPASRKAVRAPDGRGRVSRGNRGGCTWNECGGWRAAPKPFPMPRASPTPTATPKLSGRAGCGDQEVHGDPDPWRKRGCDTQVYSRTTETHDGGATPTRISPLPAIASLSEKNGARKRETEVGGGAWSEAEPTPWPRGRQANIPWAWR